MEIADFLLARIAEDEAVARAAGGEWWFTADVPPPSMRRTPEEPTRTIIDSPKTLITYEVVSQQMAEHIASHNPARVLAECEAKRQVVRLLDQNAQEAMEPLSSPPGGWASRRAPFVVALSFLALPYADHPDYDEAWRP